MAAATSAASGSKTISDSQSSVIPQVGANPGSAERRAAGVISRA